MAANRRRRVVHGGFTLVELLVVISVVALLMAILLPSLRKARENAKRVACASNMSQLGKALIGYGIELNSYPILSLHAAPSFSWCTWSFGGWTGRNPFWTTDNSGMFHRDTNQRPLNDYLFNFRGGLKGCGAGAVTTHQPPGESTQLPVYKCPSDSIELRELYEPTGPGQPLHLFNSYDDVGTSFRMNFFWWQQAFVQIRQECPGCPINPEMYRKVAERGEEYWKRYALRGAARWVMLTEQPANIGLFRQIQTVGFHRKFSAHNYAFLDGHVDYIETDTRAFSGRDWTVENEFLPSLRDTLSP